MEQVSSLTEPMLQYGSTPKESTTAPRKSIRWPAEFRRSTDAALHLGTPKSSVGPVKPASVYNSRTFID